VRLNGAKPSEFIKDLRAISRTLAVGKIEKEVHRKLQIGTEGLP
jgi:hypothetical protein